MRAHDRGQNNLLAEGSARQDGSQPNNGLDCRDLQILSLVHGVLVTLDGPGAGYSVYGRTCQWSFFGEYGTGNVPATPA